MTRKRLYMTGFGMWFVFLAIGFSFGTLRELLVTPAIGEAAGHVVGTLVVLIVMWSYIRRIHAHCTSMDLWSLGLLWLVMTIAFEFLFFHYVAGKPWKELLADYDLLNGRIWVLVPTANLLGPPVIGAILKRS